MIPRYDENAVDFEYVIKERREAEKVEVETVITFQDDTICSIRETVVRSCYSRRFSLINDHVKWKVKYWCPKSPNLYDVCVRIYEDGILTDEVGSYFGLQTAEELH